MEDNTLHCACLIELCSEYSVYKCLLGDIVLAEAMIYNVKHKNIQKQKGLTII